MNSSRTALVEEITHQLEQPDLPEVWALPGAQRLPIATDHSLHIGESICFDIRAKTPLVSILAVCFNSASDLPVLLDALARQRYRNFELVVVDNNSMDASVDILQKESSRAPYPIKIIRNSSNVGFAAANNQASDAAAGELLALLNVDTHPSPEWLSELVKALMVDDKAAAATSKTLFWSKFVDVELVSSGPFELDLESLEKSLTYKKFFLRSGQRRQMAAQSDQRHRLKISVPVQPEPLVLAVASCAAKEITVRTKFGWRTLGKIAMAPGARQKLSILLSPRTRGRDLINNAGSAAAKDGMPYDRGFGSYDDGNFGKCYVPFFCGCSVLIRRVALLGRPIFVPEFFAYYEDSELSRWLRGQGYRILYVPTSLLRHRHSATSQEGSPTWSYLVRRSSTIYRHSARAFDLAEKLKALAEEYRSLVPRNLWQTLHDFDSQLISRLESGEPLVPREQPVAIYNSYWNSKGGGELHALTFAAELQEKSPVYLISESEFSVRQLEEFFHLDLRNCRKLLIGKVTPALTARFGLFINSTFLSRVASAARNSWYLVSFPQKKASPVFLRSYRFLCNSDFTKRWTETYWGREANTDIYYPLRRNPALRKRSDDSTSAVKEKMFLTVGRFSPHGHCKNHDAIINAFAKLEQTGSAVGHYSLHAAGSVDRANRNNKRYYQHCQQLAAGRPIFLHPNCNRHELEQLYSRASFYVHATALILKNPLLVPSRCEHFGITVVEAMLHGCIPMAFHVGGPAELLRQLSVGYTYDSEDGLVATMQALMQIDDRELSKQRAKTISRAREFVLTSQAKELPPLDRV